LVAIGQDQHRSIISRTIAVRCVGQILTSSASLS